MMRRQKEIIKLFERMEVCAEIRLADIPVLVTLCLLKTNCVEKVLVELAWLAVD